MATLGATIFLFLLFKHCIIDLYLQSLIHFKTRKTEYLSLSAQIHYAEHGLGTFLVLSFFISWPMALVFGMVDYIAHWHIDFCKSRTQKRFGITSPTKGYWFLSSIDQAGHYLTYYLIVLLIS
tara:strand:- start:252 stop:620 length:369 start_codon:yes stop_codon:yes gene_type:complete